jgi:hypothetical protein
MERMALSMVALEAGAYVCPLVFRADYAMSPSYPVAARVAGRGYPMALSTIKVSVLKAPFAASAAALSNRTAILRRLML